jgi:two-component system sensor histidine kinase KdpD
MAARCRLEPVLLSSVVSRTVTAHQRRHPSRTIEVELAPDLPILLARPTWLDQILTNLLSNAEKYSPAHTAIRIEASATGDAVEVSVLDRGPGLPPEQADRVFRAFERLERDRGSAPGLGLGLTVSKRLVELMEGVITATPRPEGGTRFTFTIPPTLRRQVARPARAPPARLPRMSESTLPGAPRLPN